MNETPLWAEIESNLRSKVSQLSAYPSFIQSEVSEPYYVLTFERADGARLKVTFLYNVVRQEVSVIRQEEIKPTTGPLEQVSNYEADVQVKRVIGFLQGKLSTSFSFLQIVKVFKQLVPTGFYYEFHFDIKYSDRTTVHYLVAVNERNGQYEVVKSETVRLSAFNENALVKVENFRTIAVISRIEAILRRDKAAFLTRYPDLTSVDNNEAYFRFTFSSRLGTYFVILSFDAVKDQVSWIREQENKVQDNPEVFTEVTDFNSNPQVRPSITFLTQKITRFSTFTVVRVLRQIFVNQINYKFLISVRYSPSVVLNYFILVTESGNGVFEIKWQGF